MTKKLGFTMAEILLSLTIIGVVAAITLPSLMANINERTWNTQRKALYARMSQAIAMMPQVGGYGTLTEDESGSVTADTAAETFLTEGLSKVLKINNICDSEHLADCGVPTSYINLVGSTITWPKTVKQWNYQFVDYSFIGSGFGENGSDKFYSYSQIDTRAAAFETNNGESVVIYYSPYCASLSDVATAYSQTRMCANFIYDLNGDKGPNAVGKDIGFLSVLYSLEPIVVAPMPLSTAAETKDLSHKDAIFACTVQDSESRLPNIDELRALYYNHKFAGIRARVHWSGTIVSSSKAYQLIFAAGTTGTVNRLYPRAVLCVKR